MVEIWFSRLVLQMFVSDNTCISVKCLMLLFELSSDKLPEKILIEVSEYIYIYIYIYIYVYISQVMCEPAGPSATMQYDEMVVDSDSYV